MKTSTLQLNKINQTICVRTLFGAIVVTAFLYIYMVNSIAFNAAAHQGIMRSVSIIQSEIGGLESELITESRNIDKTLAAQFGLVKTVENEAAVVLRDNSTRLTLNE